jgi:hypothetical protein
MHGTTVKILHLGYENESLGCIRQKLLDVLGAVQNTLIQFLHHSEFFILREITAMLRQLRCNKSNNKIRVCLYFIKQEYTNAKDPLFFSQ